VKSKDASNGSSIVSKTKNLFFDKGFAGVKMAERARIVRISPLTL